MSTDQAERWVVISALIVAGVYAYRRLTEPSAPPAGLGSVLGQGSPPPLGTFTTAWGVTFLGVGIMASVSPQLGGAFAILIATSDFLANAPALFSDIGRHGGKTTSRQTTSSQAGLTVARAQTTAAAGAATGLTSIGGGDFTQPTLTGIGGGDFTQPPTLTSIGGGNF